MSSSLDSANPAAILFVHSQYNYNVIELLWFVIALFGVYKDALNKSDCSNFSMHTISIYVIGLHAVQFVNNWMKKIPRAAKLDEGRRPSPILL